MTNEEEWSCGKPGCDLGIDGHDFALAIQHIYGTTPEVAASVVDGVARRLGVGEATDD